MSKAVRKAVRKYLRIKYMFRIGDPNAEYKWERFKTADNGFGIAVPYIGKGVV